jgi:hypothetical protein
MASVELHITNPAQPNAILLGPGQAALTLRGTTTHPNPSSLFFKWYSSLYNPPGIAEPEDAPKAAMNFPNHGVSALNFSTTLALGSHVLSLTAKDIEGESLADAQRVTQAGMAGGPPSPGVAEPRVVHVFLAKLLTPSPSGTVPELSKAGTTIEVEAPLKWEMDEYKTLNRLRYIFRFDPTGGGTPVAGIPALGSTDEQIAQFQSTLTFHIPDAGHTVTYLRYSGNLPAALVVGDQYRLVVRVEDKQSPHSGHETFRIVRIVA